MTGLSLTHIILRTANSTLIRGFEHVQHHFDHFNPSSIAYKDNSIQRSQQSRTPTLRNCGFEESATAWPPSDFSEAVAS
jgi:hypothetical protein